MGVYSDLISFKTIWEWRRTMISTGKDCGLLKSQVLLSKTSSCCPEENVLKALDYSTYVVSLHFPVNVFSVTDVLFFMPHPVMEWT
jgi:hypothetical protein